MPPGEQYFKKRDKEMEVRENEARRSNIRFNGNDIVLAAKMLDKLSNTIEIIYYLMDRGDERSFVIMLISAENIDVKELMNEQKRDTDILFEIDEASSLYAVICQDTKIDGGYHFAERVFGHMKSADAAEVYCTELEVRSTTHDIKFVIFKVLETFIQSKVDERCGEVIFKSLN